ncbi:protein required for cell viability [Grosmannia clavigera kw1407]|uniref:Protein required for cell viability n=1 Tax=Grosmannia clavigera (strain kw1407 / UAMH 11150) TaxID=655863 RepID=F0XA93_GROCL|nr:protein required for cell viability [Grosmannia clavigera kw1407]EFX05895.1 protein required for cell viability [Grosmannia clavigera kw1407]
MFAKPRPKKDGLGAPPPKRRRRTDYAIEEINFDDTARADYLTGFHKRKVQRQKDAQEIAAQKAREEKIEFRKHLREQRQQAVEDHVQQVNDALRTARLAGGEVDEDDEEYDEEWSGIADEDNQPEFVNHEEEYIDEDRFTTVTVEAVNVDRDGMHRLDGRADEDDNSDRSNDGEEDGDGDATGDKGGKVKDGEKESGKDKKKKVWPKKSKKVKFRYENKIERQMSKSKQKRKR